MGAHRAGRERDHVSWIIIRRLICVALITLSAVVIADPKIFG